MSWMLLFPSLKARRADEASRTNDTFFSARGCAFLLAFILAVAPVWAKEAAPVAADPETEKRMIALSEDLRCLVCQNETIAASRADFANDLRREIREQMQANKSDKEIVDFLVARYGEFVLYRPPVKSTTLLLWFGPFILLLGGAIALVVYVKQRRKQIQEPQLSDQQLKQAEDMLKESKGNNA